MAFASTGERLGDFEPFRPDRLAGRILGMGDMLTLAEKAEAADEDAQAAESAERALAGGFTLDDFLVQMRQVRKLGGLGDVLAHLPGAQAGLAAEAGVDERRLARMEAIVCSMTPAERSQPAIIDSSRRRRIAAGSGTSTAEVGELLRNFNAARKMMRNAGVAGGRRRAKGSKGRRGKGSGRVTPAGGTRTRAASDLLERLESGEPKIRHPRFGADPDEPGPAPPAWPGR